MMPIRILSLFNLLALGAVFLGIAMIVFGVIILASQKKKQ